MLCFHFLKVLLFGSLFLDLWRAFLHIWSVVVKAAVTLHSLVPALVSFYTHLYGWTFLLFVSYSFQPLCTCNILLLDSCGKYALGCRIFFKSLWIFLALSGVHPEGGGEGLTILRLVYSGATHSPQDKNPFEYLSQDVVSGGLSRPAGGT